MALKSVVVDSFFEKVTAFLKGWEELGPLTLAMLDRAYTSGGSAWNLTIAAPWLDGLNLYDATRVVDDKAKQFLGSMSGRYSGTHVQRTNDYLVRTLVPIFDIPQLGTAYRVDALELSSFDFDEVVVLVANPATLPVATHHQISA